MDLEGSNDSVNVGAGSLLDVVAGSDYTIRAGFNDLIKFPLLRPIKTGDGDAVDVGSNVGALKIDDFTDREMAIDLLNGVGSFATPGQAYAALASDGSGGSLLSLGANGSIDFVGVAPTSLSAANFKIG
jgi:hypothetical protein